MALPALHDQVGARMRAAGQRYTGNRVALVEVLDGIGRPVPIPEILKAGPDLPQSSVYRNLSVLEAAGVVRRVLGVDEFARYELAEDLTEHHHHLVCTSCGDVSDIRLSPRLERSVERAIEEVSAGTGFRLAGHRLDLVGTCSNCA
ncbi:MAG: Fur family transcriptional regulator, ferric uptake regulator [Actinomycetota bacterium]|jgi:Fe2+ or Zn2+ uptake regulation protein|nr:Fur family transcriptional regulator, ferric uptake regulator [Actinomycetota bacterium]